LPRPRTRPMADVQLPQPASDGEIYVTAATASAITGVHPRTVRTWMDKGWLAEAGREDGPTGQILFKYRDVIRADGRARNVLTVAA
jgi:hypothetical protein